MGVAWSYQDECGSFPWFTQSHRSAPSALSQPLLNLLYNSLAAWSSGRVHFGGFLVAKTEMQGSSSLDVGIDGHVSATIEFVKNFCQVNFNLWQMLILTDVEDDYHSYSSSSCFKYSLTSGLRAAFLSRWQGEELPYPFANIVMPNACIKPLPPTLPFAPHIHLWTPWVACWGSIWSVLSLPLLVDDSSRPKTVEQPLWRFVF